METDNILEKIYKACLKFQVPLTLDETYDTIVHEAIKLVKGDDGLIVRCEDNTLTTVYGSTKSAAAYKVRQDGNTHTSLTENVAIVLHNEDIKKVNTTEDTDIASLVFIPLSYKEHTEGVLILRSKKEKYFSKKETDILKLFGSFASLAIKKNELYEETKNALEVRDMFISLASHELRTPLTSINGYIQLLHSRKNNLGPSESKWINELYEESKRLTNLVRELLEVNRIKQGQLQFILRETKFSDIVMSAIERCEMAYPEREITFENTVEKSTDIVIGDSEKLLQVVTALLENAIKFSPRESLITIELSIKNQTIIMRVSDKGSGIAREDLTKIFEGFYKGANNHKAGMGVGLLLAKHIINYHKGSLSVQSELQKGTVVEVRLPQQKI